MLTPPTPQLQKELNIPTIYQRLFFKGKELTDNSETVSSLGILANDSLDLREEKENDDTLNLDTNPFGRDPPEEGRAFGGTILSGVTQRANTSKEANHLSSPKERTMSNHCPVCTFINSDDLTFCTMCGSRTKG
jgi:ubiquitin carboxyl-terminal hydrolase 48